MGIIWKKKKQGRRKKNERSALTLTGLLMEGLDRDHSALFHETPSRSMVTV
jgi:hypothetical protein